MSDDQILDGAPLEAETTPPVVVEDQTVQNQTEQTNTPDDAEPKTFTQEELDQIIQKRLAKEQRKYQREYNERLAEATRPKAPVDVKPDQYGTVDEYAEALATKKAEQMLAQREAQKQYDNISKTYVEKEEAARDKYDDFEQVAYNESLRITDLMADVIKAADNGPDIAYYLGSNPKEAERISRLPHALQAKEIGKIEAKLSVNPPEKRSSSAPAPISPVNARKSGSAAYSTTDPRSITAMSTSDWINAERQRQEKALAAKFRR